MIRFNSVWAWAVLSSLPFLSSSVHSSPREEQTLFGATPELLSIMPREDFMVDHRLKRNVDFWVKIYSKYDIDEGVIHDAKYVDKVYEELALRPKDGGPGGDELIKSSKKKWKDALMSLHLKQKHGEIRVTELNAAEKRVFELFADVNEPNKYLNAAHRKRLRFQLGQKSNFKDGLYNSGSYLPLMEEVFRREGLPVLLTRLPFVESSFNVRARSKVGASGVWQFMRSTGRLYLMINDAVDERNDPIRATEAAAKLLKTNFESLRKWPLAVTAYNHGRKGMMRAVLKVGSEELEDVVAGYNSRTFGFASSNFFTEFLAAAEVEKNYQKYFGNIERSKPLQFVEAPISHYIDLRDLVRFLKLDMAAVRSLNPGLTEAVYNGERRVPAGYRLRLPLESQTTPDMAVKLFLAGYEQIPEGYKLSAQARGKTSVGSSGSSSGRRGRHSRRAHARKSVRAEQE